VTAADFYPFPRFITMSGRAPSKMGTAFSSVLKDCPGDVLVYGACVQRNLRAMEKGACEKEFSALRQCFTKAVRDFWRGHHFRWAAF